MEEFRIVRQNVEEMLRPPSVCRREGRYTQQDSVLFDRVAVGRWHLRFRWNLEPAAILDAVLSSANVSQIDFGDAAGTRFEGTANPLRIQRIAGQIEDLPPVVAGDLAEAACNRIKPRRIALIESLVEEERQLRASFDLLGESQAGRQQQTGRGCRPRVRRARVPCRSLDRWRRDADAWCPWQDAVRSRGA